MTLEKRVQAFVAALTHDQPFVEAFDALVARSKTASPLERDAAIRMLLEWTHEHPELTGYTCVASGALVEDGASELVGLDLILDRLADGAEVLANAGTALDEADLDAHHAPPTALSRDERRWVAGWKNHVRGAMARLARSVPARRRARAHTRLDAAVRALGQRTWANHLWYMTEILDMLDDEPLTVVDLCAGGELVRYRVSGVRNGFHLMTLLDGGDPRAIVQREQEVVTAKHSYFSWPALREADDVFTTQGLGALLWGEPPARHLPVFEGVRTIVRAPLGLQRSWGVSFISPIHDAVTETLVVEQTLAPGEARPVLQRIARAARGE